MVSKSGLSVFDSLEVSNGFVQDVVAARRDIGSGIGPSGCRRTSVPGVITGCVRTASVLRPVFGVRSVRYFAFLLNLVRHECHISVGLATLLLW